MYTLVRAIDRIITHVVYRSVPHFGLVAFWRTLSFLGSGWILLPIALGLWVRRWRRTIWWLFVAVTVQAMVVGALKGTFGRVRPCYADAEIVSLVIDTPRDCSLPSGHAAGAFTFAFFVLALDRRWGVLLLFVALAIGASRVALGVHYPTDVLAGAVVGGLVGHVCARQSQRA